MRDYIGISPGSVPTDLTKLEPYLPELRRDLGVIDFYLRDLSRGMGRIQKGEVPDASGDPIGDVNGLFWLLAGRPGNQLAYGGTFSGGSATISSTSNPTKGFVYFGDARTSGFDESNQRVGLNVAAPVARLDMLVGAPTNQFARPSADYANNSAIVWTNEVGATTNLYQSVDESAAGDSDYVTHSRQLGTLQLRLSSVTDPGVNTGHVLRIRARVNGVLNGNDHMLITLDQVGIGGSNIVTSNNLPDDAGWSPSPIQMDTILTTYEWALSTAEAALITDYSQLVVGMGYYTGYDAGSTIEVSWVELEVPAVGGVAVAETLQKWSTGTYTDLLSFLGDGAGSTLDLTLSGDSPLRVSSGGGTSGLRFLTSSTNGRIEAGTSAQANMNLVLSGTRATAGTLLTSDFTAHLMNGALDVFLSTDRTGLRVRQFTTATVDLAQFSANNGTSHWYRIGSDGQSYFASSTTAGVVNIGAGAGSTVFKVGTTGTTGVLTLKPNQSSIFEIDIAGLSTTRFTTATKWSFLNSTALRGTTSGELTFAGPATITDHTLTWPSALPAATSALHVGTGGAMSYANLATTYQALDADLTAIALLTGDGGLYRTGSDTWALRDLAVGSDRLTISNADGVSGNPSYDASMSSASWDWTRGVSVTPSIDELGLTITANTAQSVDVVSIRPFGGDGTFTAAGGRLLRVGSSGTVGVGDYRTAGNAVVKFDIRVPTTQTANIAQVINSDSVALFSIGSVGAFVVGQGNAANSNLTRFTVHPGQSQSQDILTIRDPGNNFTYWGLTSTGRMKFSEPSSSAATTFDRAAAGSSHTLTWPNAQGGASTVLTNDGSGGLSWAAAAAATHALLSATHSDTTAGAPTDADSIIRANGTTWKVNTAETAGTAHIDFNTAKAIAMACDNGATFPTSPAPTEGQWFLFEPTGRSVLYQRVGGTWQPICGFGTANIYVATTGNDSTGTGASAAPYLTIQFAYTQIPPIYNGTQTIIPAAGTYTETITVSNRIAAGNAGIVIQGASTLGNGKTVSVIVTAGTSTTQPVFTLNNVTGITAGDIAVFTTGGAIRVVDSVSGSNVTLCGNAVTGQSVGSAVQFRQFGTDTAITRITGTVYMYARSVTLQYLKIAPASGQALNLFNDGCTFTECYITGTSAVVQMQSVFLNIADCAIVHTGADYSGALQIQGSALLQIGSSLIKGNTTSRGAWCILGGIAYIFDGCVFTGLHAGVTGSPGFAIFTAFTTQIFIKGCTYGVNETGQTLTTQALNQIQYSGNTADMLPYVMELGLSVRRREVPDTVGDTVVVTDHIVAYTSLTASRTLNLLAVAKYGAGKQIVVKNETANGIGSGVPSAAIVIDANGAELIDGSGTKTVNTPYGAVVLYTTTTGFFTMADR